MVPWPGFIYLYHICTVLCLWTSGALLWLLCWDIAFLVSFHASRIYCYLYYCVLHTYCDAICIYMHCAVCFLFHFSGYFIIALGSFFITTDSRVLFSGWAHGHARYNDRMCRWQRGLIFYLFRRLYLRVMWFSCCRCDWLASVSEVPSLLSSEW
jgi:hypothetical protein